MHDFVKYVLWQHLFGNLNFLITVLFRFLSLSNENYIDYKGCDLDKIGKYELLNIFLFSFRTHAYQDRLRTLFNVNFFDWVVFLDKFYRLMWRMFLTRRDWWWNNKRYIWNLEQIANDAFVKEMMIQPLSFNTHFNSISMNWNGILSCHTYIYIYIYSLASISPEQLEWENMICDIIRFHFQFIKPQKTIT